MRLKEAIEKIKERKNLSFEEAYEVFKEISQGNFKEDELEEFLIGLREKGEVWEEIAGAVKAYREIMKKLPHALHGENGVYLVDTCGTGGDHKNTFNFSTAVALVLPAVEGIFVAKHGNRAVSSRCGSADFIEALGIPLEIPSELLARLLEDTGFAFIFAPLYHQAFKLVAPVRKKIGRSIFNILGPLLNPAEPDYQLLGVFDFLLTEKIAYVLDALRVKRGMVVFGEGGFDEITVTGSTKVSELRDERITTYYIDPEPLGIERCEDISLLQGGDARENIKIFEKILHGDLEGPVMDMFLMNLAGALYICDKGIDYQAAFKLAKELIYSKKALEKVKKIIETYSKVKN